MIPYFLLTILPFIIFGIYKDDKKEQRIFTICSFFFMFFLLLSFRDVTIGVDVESYKDTFEKIASAPLKNIFVVSDKEKGYVLLNKLVSVFTGDFQVFLVVVALITVIPLAYFYSKETGNPLVCIALFMAVAPFSMFFSGLRQVIAMMFVVPAYFYTKKKKFLPFLAMVLLAFLFHKSALIILLLYPIYHIKFPKVMILLIAFVLVLVFVFRTQIFLGVMKILGGKYLERYGKIEDTGAFTMVALFVIFCVYSYILPDEKEETDEIRGLRNLLFLIIGIQLFATINPIIMRMNYYFILLIPILIPKIADHPSEKNKWLAKLSKFAMVLFFLAWFFYTAYRGADILQIFPYKFFLR